MDGSATIKKEQNGAFFPAGQHLDEITCPQCPRKFKSRVTLEAHYRLHLNQKQHKCTICNKVYVQQANLKYHMIGAHENRRPFKCGVCLKAFSQPGNLQTHLAIHQTFRSYACSECKQSFTQLGNLKGHCKNKHAGMLYLSCGICLMPFENAKELVHHIKGCRSMNTYRCDLCNDMFCDPTDLNLHMQTLHKGYEETNKRKRKSRASNGGLSPSFLDLSHPPTMVHVPHRTPANGGLSPSIIRDLSHPPTMVHVPRLINTMPVTSS